MPVTAAPAIESRSRQPASRVEFEPLPVDPTVLRSLLVCFADSVSVIGRDGATRFITPRGLEQFGTANQSLVIGQPWLERWPDACARVLAGPLETALSGQRAQRDIQCENDRGEASWWEVCFSPWTVTTIDGRADFVIAVARDVTDRHAAIESAKLLARESHHRVRNMLSMVQAIIRISAGVDRDPKQFIDSVEERIDALARTHALLTSDRQGEVDLRCLLGAELAPFGEPGRITLEGPSLIVREPTASALSLAIHELTSNAVKYGALSCPVGQLNVSWSVDSSGSMKLHWSEQGGPEIRLGAAGFGSMLLEELPNDQLLVERDWRNDGLLATITVARNEGNLFRD